VRPVTWSAKLGYLGGLKSAAEPGMAAHSPESTVGRYIGPPINTALAALATWLFAGSTGTVGPALSLFVIGGGICGLVFTLSYRHYFGILGAGNKRRGTPERQDYDALRDNLAKGNLIVRLYADLLTKFLDWLDRFFGDAGMADRPLFLRIFGLRTPVPLWTAPALERCLLLALIYPITTIFLFWAVSGHVGPAENALHMNPRLSTWQRWLAAAVFGFSVFALWRAVQWAEWKRFIWTVVCVVAFVIAVALSVAPLGGVVVGGAHAALPTTNIAMLMAPTTPPVITIIVAFLGAVSVATAIAVISAGVGALRRFNPRWEGAFLSFFILSMVAACFTGARWLSPLPIWQMLGPLLLFLGLFTLLNAPFDWASVGLTRALLRRGLERGGWWPYWFAMVDAALATVIVVFLAMITVVGVQAFDSFAAQGGGRSVLPLEPLFNGIDEHPTAPEYWWIYALLLSTMIPSLVNLMIGGASFVRGVPGLPGVLFRRLPAGRAVPAYKRGWIALVITVQNFGGAAVGIVAQVLLAILIVGYIMPLFARDLLDMARGVASFNLPARVGQLFGVSL
jgi:hypothetical protein